MAESPSSLADWRRWLQIEDCPCQLEWRSLGRLHGVSMGMGWVRTSTEPECPHHGVEAERRRQARRRAAETDRQAGRVRL